MEIAKTLRNEWVVAVTGKVNQRPERNVQADKQNGNIELEILGIEVLNEAETLPFRDPLNPDRRFEMLRLDGAPLPASESA